MFKIGKLSEITGISIKTIRYYEEMGLIRPIEVDRWTNYRYYDETSIEKLSQISYLKGLGFSLNEILNLNEDVIKTKTKAIRTEIENLKTNLNKLSSIYNKKGELIMKNFVNDERVVGKWVRLGTVKSKEQFLSGNIEKTDIFNFDEIYFLPNGEEYWVFSWTKGALFLKNRKFNYEIIGNKMLIGIVDNLDDQTAEEICDYVVYEKIDNLAYSIDEIKIEDNVNIPFIKDEKVVGFWEAADYIPVDKVKDYNPEIKNWKDRLFLTQYSFQPNGKLLVQYSNGNSRTISWSKNVVLDNDNKTASEYQVKEINGETYLIAEWKSGDYIFGGKVFGCYVFKKIK